jgi:hypothetical protein
LSRAGAPQRDAAALSPLTRTLLRALETTLLLGGFLALTIVTWRRWADVQVDFGRELYNPWRISSGALLYRDLMHYYGPLSSYVNAALFRLAGVSYGTLIGANLVVSLATLALLRAIARRLAGDLAGSVVAASFLLVFCFGNYTFRGNYTFLSPYSEDATYGTLAALAAIPLIDRYLRAGALAPLCGAGVLFGLVYLTKPEIAVAALVFAALALSGLVLVDARFGSERVSARTQHLPIKVSEFARAARSRAPAWSAWALGAALPPAAFTLYFVSSFGTPEGLWVIHSPWLAGLGSRSMHGALTNLAFLGFDHPAENLWDHLWSSLVAVSLLAGAAVFALAIGRLPQRGRLRLAALLALTGLAALTAYTLPWFRVGRVLFLASLAGFAWHAVRAFSEASREEALARVLRLAWSGFACAMMARMILNGRVYHYGFYQALPAFAELVLLLLKDLPAAVERAGGSGTALRTALTAALAVGLATFPVHALSIYRLKRLPVGAGGDRLLTYLPRIDTSGTLMNALLKEIRTRHTDARSLVVFPEGVMLNYLARLPSSLAISEFVPPALAYRGQDAILAELGKSPPDLVVLISRDLTEFGQRVFGSNEASGRRIIEWLRARYDVVFESGGDPLNPYAA